MRRAVAIIASLVVGFTSLGLLVGSPAEAKPIVVKLSGTVSGASVAVSKTDTTSIKKHTLIDGTGSMTLSGSAQGTLDFSFHDNATAVGGRGTATATFTGLIGSHSGTLALAGPMNGMRATASGTVTMPLKVLGGTAALAGTTGNLKFVGGLPSSAGSASYAGTLRIIPPPPPTTTTLPRASTTTRPRTTTTAPRTTTTSEPVIVDDPLIDLITATPSGAVGRWPSDPSNPDVKISTPQAGQVITPDGRYVAFGSYATNLVANDHNDAGDVFVRDRQTGTTQRVSLLSSGAEATFPGGTHRHFAGMLPGISANGRYVVFTSEAALVPEDTTDGTDVYRYDRTADTLDLVSESLTGGGSDATRVSWSSVSNDGRYVTFVSDATNLVTDDTDPPTYPIFHPETKWVDVFVRDMQTGTTTLVSTPANAEGTFGFAATMSGNGRYIAYTGGTNIAPGVAWSNQLQYMYRYDRVTGTTAEVQFDQNGARVPADGAQAAITADGNTIVFAQSSTYDITADTPQGAELPSGHIYLRDMTAGTITLVDNVTGGRMGAERAAMSPGVSADGRYVVFSCACQRWTYGTGHRGVYRADVVTDQFVEMDANIDRIVGNADSLIIAGSAGTITNAGDAVFESDASNLVENDTNNHEDVFVSTPQ